VPKPPATTTATYLPPLSVKAAVVALMFAYWMLSVAVIAIRFQPLFSFTQEPCGTGPDSPAADGLIPFAVAAVVIALI
jgi:hypothetical protein